MDIVATALTAAWLDAVRKTQTAVPLGTTPTGRAEDLTDVMENALRHGGVDSADPGWSDPARTVQPDPLAPGQVIDLSV
jgi:hypothetical protein